MYCKQIILSFLEAVYFTRKKSLMLFFHLRKVQGDLVPEPMMAIHRDHAYQKFQLNSYNKIFNDCQNCKVEKKIVR